MTSRRLLLDTCAIIWLAQGQKVSSEVEDALGRAVEDDCEVAVSAMSAWEIGMLISKGRLPATKSAGVWFREFVDRAGVVVEAASPDILIASSFLPLPIHNDPVDRIIIATARELDLTLITRDRAILAYGAAGHVKTIAC